MGYFIVDKMPVFLSRKRYKALEDEALKDKDPAWRGASRLAGNRANKERYALMYDILVRKSTDDRSAFRSEWLRFDMSGEEASANVWDLLYDYCRFRGYAFLSDDRDLGEQMIESYEGDDYQYPMGRTFSLNHHVKPARWWWRFTHRMPGRKVRIVVNSGEVIRLVGNLAGFEVHGGGFVLSCGEHLGIRFGHLRTAESAAE